MSTPALKPRPSARSTTAPTCGSRPAARTASARSYQPATVSALTGGASTTISATPSRVVVETPMRYLSTKHLLEQTVAEGFPGGGMALTLDLTGKTAVITGGVRGVGAGISRAFLEAGADVVAVARRAPDVLPEAGGRTARFVSLDVRDPDAAQAFVDGLDRVDVLVNNAGGAPFLPVADGELRTHLKIIELNLTSALIMARAVHARMRALGSGGSIVNIGSVSGERPSPGTAAYGAAKAGLRNLTQSLAVEWAPHVRVN